MSEDVSPSFDTYHLWIQGGLFLLCLVLSALFSASETALTSMSKLRIKRLFNEEEEAYQRLTGWLENPNRYLATILVGNHFVNIVASVMAAQMADEILRGYARLEDTVAAGAALAVALATFFLLIFGEICPKTYSREHAVSLSLRAVGPLEFLHRILKPLIGFFLSVSNLVNRLLGGPVSTELTLVTEDDVRALIEMSEKEGLLEEEEREMIHSIIDFGDTLVKEIMTPRVDLLSLDVSQPYEEVIEKVVDWGHSRIPVYEQELDRIVGILYVKDLLRVGQNGKHPFDLRGILRPPLFIPKTKKVGDLLQTFKKEKNHMAIVVDEYGLTAGVVTIEDVLEEIVGDIQDEYDTEEPAYLIQEDGSYIADAKINLDILSEILRIEFPEEDVETLGGFISTLMGTVPKAGEEVLYRSLRFIVLDADDRKINKVRIHPVEPAAEEPAPITDSSVENA